MSTIAERALGAEISNELTEAEEEKAWRFPRKKKGISPRSKTISRNRASSIAWNCSACSPRCAPMT